MNNVLKIILITLFCMNYSVGHGQIKFSEFRSEPYYKKLGKFKKEFTFNRMALVQNWLTKKKFDHVVMFTAQDKVVGVGNTTLKTKTCDLKIEYDVTVSVSHEKYEIRIDNIKTVLFKDDANYKNIRYYKDHVSVYIETAAFNKQTYTRRNLTRNDRLIIDSEINESENKEFSLDCLDSKQGIEEVYKILSKEYSTFSKELSSYLKKIQKF